MLALGGYLQYFLVGWYVSNHDLTSATRRKIYLLGLLMLALEIGLTLGLSYRTPRLPYYNYSMGYIKNFYDIANFPEFCLVLALFTWMKEKESKIWAWSFKDRLPLLAGITFGIYLLHPFVIYHFLPVMKKYLGASPVYIRYFAYPLAIYLISAALTVLLRKILGVKYVLT